MTLFPPSMAPVLSFSVTFVFLRVLLRRLSHRVLDRPNERSLHQTPVPRTGSVGVLAGLAVTLPFVAPGSWWPLWLGVVLVMAVSFLDDLAGVPIVWRLLTQVVAAALCVTGFFSGTVGLVGCGALVLAMVWMINLYNFMDGMDGLAGGMAVFGFGFLAIAAWLGGHGSLAVVSACIASGAGAFLFYNFHPARMFLGDAGSTALGFLAAGVGLIGWGDGVWSIWVPVLVFSPFIVDATVTLVWRVFQGKRFWQAHRAHYYQRLVLSGWSHRKTALVEYGLMVSCGLGALVFQQSSGTVQLAIAGLWALVFLGLAQSVSMIEQRIPGHGVFDGR